MRRKIVFQIERAIDELHSTFANVGTNIRPEVRGFSAQIRIRNGIGGQQVRAGIALIPIFHGLALFRHGEALQGAVVGEAAEVFHGLHAQHVVQRKAVLIVGHVLGKGRNAFLIVFPAQALRGRSWRAGRLPAYRGN